MMIVTKLGWRVLPLKVKKPILNDWPRNATSDPMIVEYWWNTRYTGASCGILTGPESGIWVLDLDVKNGVDGTESLAELAAGRELPETFTVRSMSGRGLHMYWAWPELDEGAHLGNSGGSLGPGIDVKGVGGQVRAPHKATDIIDNRWPVHAPDWLVEAAVGASKNDDNGSESYSMPSGWFDAASAVADAVSRIARADAGERNITLNTEIFKLARWSHATGVTEDQARDVCRSGCRRNGLWAEESEQCVATFNSAWFAGLTKRGDDESE